MNELPDTLFRNPVWHALRTKHKHLALSLEHACRYPADVAPLAAIDKVSTTALCQLRSLLGPGEPVWLVGENFPDVPQLSQGHTLDCLHMFLPQNVVAPEPIGGIADLTANSAHEMVALTDVAFPGFFRVRTCEMGSYFGVRLNGELVAMAGERLLLDGYSEISGVCTHPAHRGRGYAAGLIWHLVRAHRSQGLLSWLHVVATNHPAIALYRRMGFRIARRVTLTSISCVSS